MAPPPAAAPRRRRRHGPAAPTRLRPLSQRGSASTPRLRGRPPGDSPGGRRVLGSRRAGGWSPSPGWGVGALGGGGGQAASQGGGDGAFGKRRGSGRLAAGGARRPSTLAPVARPAPAPAQAGSVHSGGTDGLRICDDHCVPSLCQHCGSAALSPPAGPRAGPAEWCWDGGSRGTGAAG